MIGVFIIALLVFLAFYYTVFLAFYYIFRLFKPANEDSWDNISIPETEEVFVCAKCEQEYDTEEEAEECCADEPEVIRHVVQPKKRTVQQTQSNDTPLVVTAKGKK